jgi:hypothetical protein
LPRAFMEPYLHCDWALCQYVIDRLPSLLAKVALLVGLEAMPQSPVASPMPPPEGQPQKDLDLERSPSFPYEVMSQERC